MNKVMLAGKLGKEPELRYNSSGTPITHMRIGTDESYEGEEGNTIDHTEWHTIVVSQRQAETCAFYLQKAILFLWKAAYKLANGKTSGENIDTVQRLEPAVCNF